MTATGARRAIEILLVEDSPTDRLIALEGLRHASMTNSLNVVENGVEAMAYLRREGKFADAKRPDLILLDLNLPKKDGREVLMEIKHDPLLKFIPVIVLTTSGADEDVARAYADHANSYITKPVDFPRFTQALEAIGKYWFEVVTLPPDGIVQRLARSDKAHPSSPAVWQGQTLGVLLVADDPSLVRELRELSSEAMSVRIEFAHVEALDDLRAALERSRPDVLMVDLAIAGSEGLTAYRRARSAAPNTAVVVLTSDEARGEMALREGAEDFMGGLDHNRSTLLRALRYATSRKRMQDQLRRAQRMEAIGHITSGVAHDFNNLLTVLHGHAELLSDSTTLAAVGDSVQGIKDVSERAAQLTRQLLAFSQKRALQLEPVDLGRVVNDFSRMLRRVLGRDVHLDLRLSPHAPNALADVGLLEQALLDLAIYARDGMQAGGELVLETDGVTLDAASLSHPNAYAGAFATLGVRFTGSNADSERDDPLATKDRGHGGRLALSIAHGIAEQHKGWIALDSERGVATRMRLYLPVAQPAPAVARAAFVSRSQGGTENILLVDDESPVRRMAKAILGRQGYQVLEARSGADAITTFEESARRVDLLLTDVVMPGGMTGRELADELQRRDPSLKVIFTSGYGREQAVPGLALNEGVDFLSKPYAASRLLGAVRHVLDARPMVAEPESDRT